MPYHKNCGGTVFVGIDGEPGLCSRCASTVAISDTSGDLESAIIDWVRIHRPQSGDIIVLHCTVDLSPEHAEKIREVLQRLFPPDIRVVVLGPAYDSVDVIRKS